MPSSEFLTIALPVWNEELVLEKNVRAIFHACQNFWPDRIVHIVIADNDSRDRTPDIATRLATEIPSVHSIHLPEPGKGGAIRKAWELFPARISCFMDIDLSTDLFALPHLVSAIEDGADVAYGSRIAPDAHVSRSWQRHIVSFGYRSAVKFFTGFSDDVACGFKAISENVMQSVVPEITDTHFAFDREIVLRAHAHGLKLTAIPVAWVEARDVRRSSTVHLASVALRDIRHLRDLQKKLRGARSDLRRSDLGA